MKPIDNEDKNRILECSDFNADGFDTINNLIQNDEYIKAGMMMNCMFTQIEIFRKMCNLCAIQHVIQIDEEDLQKTINEAIDFVNNFLEKHGLAEKIEKMDIKKEKEKIDKMRKTLNIVDTDGTKCN